MQTIFFVDDADDLRRLYTKILRDLGYHVLEAWDGIEALSGARQYRDNIHLLITDVNMPGMGGVALQRAFRVCHPETAVLFISGSFEMNPVLGEHFLKKPFNPPMLLLRIDQIFCEQARSHLAELPPAA